MISPNRHWHEKTYRRKTLPSVGLQRISNHGLAAWTSCIDCRADHPKHQSTNRRTVGKEAQDETGLNDPDGH